MSGLAEDWDLSDRSIKREVKQTKILRGVFLLIDKICPKNAIRKQWRSLNKFYRSIVKYSKMAWFAGSSIQILLRLIETEININLFYCHELVNLLVYF